MKHFNFLSLLGTATLIFTLAVPTLAEAKRHRHRGQHHRVNPEQRAENRVQHMSKKLNLSDKQAQQIRQILTEKYQKLRELRIKQSLSKTERQAKVSAIHQDTHKKIHGILSSEQIQRIKDQRNAKITKRAARHLEKLKVVLELSSEQIKAIEAIQAKHIKAKIALYDSTKGDRRIIRKALKEQRKTTRLAIREQLTEAQAAKFDAMKRHRKQGRRHQYGKGRNHWKGRQGPQNRVQSM